MGTSWWPNTHPGLSERDEDPQALLLWVLLQWASAQAMAPCTLSGGLELPRDPTKGLFGLLLTPASLCLCGIVCAGRAGS